MGLQFVTEDCTAEEKLVLPGKHRLPHSKL